MKITDEKRQELYTLLKIEIEKQFPQFLCTIEQDVFVIQINWKNTTYFNPNGITKDIKSFRHIIKINKNGSFQTTDVMIEDEKTIGLGNLTISKSMFSGESFGYSLDLSLGIDNNTNQFGIIRNEFTTDTIKDFCYDFLISKKLFVRYKERLRFGIVSIILSIFIMAMVGVLFKVTDGDFPLLSALSFAFAWLLPGVLFIAISKTKINTMIAVSGIFTVVLLMLITVFFTLPEMQFVAYILIPCLILPIIFLIKGIKKEKDRQRFF